MTAHATMPSIFVVTETTPEGASSVLVATNDAYAAFRVAVRALTPHLTRDHSSQSGDVTVQGWDKSMLMWQFGMNAGTTLANLQGGVFVDAYSVNHAAATAINLDLILTALENRDSSTTDPWTALRSGGILGLNATLTNARSSQ